MHRPLRSSFFGGEQSSVIYKASIWRSTSAWPLASTVLYFINVTLDLTMTKGAMVPTALAVLHCAAPTWMLVVGRLSIVLATISKWKEGVVLRDSRRSRSPLSQ